MGKTQNRPCGRFCVKISWRFLDHLHVDGDTGRKIEVCESLDHFGRWVQDVDKALMNAHFELLARVFVDER